MLCHLPLLLPLVGLLLFFILPFPVALSFFLPLAALSAVLGAKVLKAMKCPVTTGPEGMVGGEGVVVRAEGRAGVIQYRNELWSAVAREPMVPGERVTIKEIQGLTAVVRQGRG